MMSAPEVHRVDVLSGVVAGRMSTSEAVAGTGYEPTVIASVVIGGTRLFGGAGTLFGTVTGALPSTVAGPDPTLPFPS